MRIAIALAALVPVTRCLVRQDGEYTVIRDHGRLMKPGIRFASAGLVLVGLMLVRTLTSCVTPPRDAATGWAVIDTLANSTVLESGGLQVVPFPGHPAVTGHVRRARNFCVELTIGITKFPGETARVMQQGFA